MSTYWFLLHNLPHAHNVYAVLNVFLQKYTDVVAAASSLSFSHFLPYNVLFYCYQNAITSTVVWDDSGYISQYYCITTCLSE